jgi:hypothetical protein
VDLIYFRTDDGVATRQAAQFLPEGRTYPIDNNWSVCADKAHVQGMKDHNHIQLKGHEVAVINQDGTPSHKSDLSQVPGWVLAWVKDKGLTESYFATQTIADRVPAAVIAEAVRHEMTVQGAVDHLSKTSEPRSS